MDECNQADDRAVVNATLDKFLSEATAPLRRQLEQAERRSEIRKQELDQAIAWLAATAELLWPSRSERHFKEIPAAVRALKVSGEQWQRLHDEQVKAQAELAEWVQVHATGGFGQLHSTVALRMLKEQCAYIEQLEARNRRLKEQIYPLKTTLGDQDKLGFPTFPAGRIPASPALRAAMGAALESGRSCSVCAKQGPHVAHMILDALTAYDTAKADEANAQASKRQGGLCL